jgi:hypothetical protein
MVRLLGKMSDREVAERLGLKERRVRFERFVRGIPAFNRVGKIRRTPALVKLLRLRTSEVCAITGICNSTVSKLRKEFGVPAPPPRSAWTPRALAALGKKPDALIAAELGLKEITVARKRQELGLQRLRSWTAAEEALVGTAPDAVIARRLHRSIEAVAKRRRLLKLPPPPTRGAPASAPAPRRRDRRPRSR